MVVGASDVEHWGRVELVSVPTVPPLGHVAPVSFAPPIPVVPPVAIDEELSSTIPVEPPIPSLFSGCCEAWQPTNEASMRVSGRT
jgi:hypothetical protein